MPKLTKKRLILFLAIIGPGIITSAADNDAGGIITYSKSGALYKYDMLWIIVLLTFVLAMTQEMCARMGVVTQKGLGELIRENFGVKWTMFALTTLFIANLATTVAEFAGIAASLSIFGISKFISVPIAGVFIWFLVVKGTFKLVERVFLLLTLLFGTYIISGLAAHPNWHEVATSTFIPKINLNPNFLFLAIAVIGTTITPWMQFFLQATVVDKGVRLKELKYQKWDVFIGSFLTDVVSFFIIVATGTLVFGHVNAVNEAKDVANALAPVAGNYAKYLFAIGLFNASLLAAAVLPLSTAYTFTEAFGWEIGISRKFAEAPMFYSIYTLSIIFGVAVVLLPLNLVDTMISAQAINGILLPVILVFMLKLINRKDVMGKYTNSKLYNFVIWTMVIVLIAMTIGTLVGTLLGYG